MIVRVTLRPRDKFDISSTTVQQSPNSLNSVDIVGDTLSWKLEKLDEYSPYLVIYNDEEKREEAVFATGTWLYAQIVPEDGVEGDEDVADYTS